MVLNYDYQQKVCSVEAAHLSMKEFKALVHNFVKDDNTYVCGKSYTLKIDDMKEYANTLLGYGTSISCPFSINPEYTSVSATHEHLVGKNILGFNMLENNVPVFGVLVSSNCGIPVVTIVYPAKDKQLKIYIPVKGNGINPYLKCQIGEEPPVSRFMTYWDDDINLAKNYLSLYHQNFENYTLDCDAMRDEIIETFSVS